MVKLGIIGTGRISDWVYKGIQEEPRISVKAICSRTEDAANAFISRHPELEGAKIYTSVQELAEDPDIDAVYIGTPNQTHHSYTLACLKAGKHVLCEKPFSVSGQEALEMAEAARASGRLLMEAMISTFNPNFRAFADRINSIGPLRQYSSNYCQYSSKYESLKKGITASCFQSGTAGALRDIGIYALYPLVTLFGRPEKTLSSLTTYQTADGPTDIHGSLLLDYGQMQASITYSKVCDSLVPTELSGEDGNLILDDIRIARRAEIAPHNPPSSGQGPKPERTIIAEGIDHNEYYYEFKEFADLLEAGMTESKINSLDASVTVIKIIEEALRQNNLK